MKTRTQLLIGCIASALLSVSALATTNNAFSIGIRFAPTEVSGGGQATMAATDIAGVTPVVQGNWNNAFGDDQANATTELRDIKGTVSNLVADNNGAATPTTATVTWGNADPSVRGYSPNTWANTGRGEENNGWPTGSANRKLMTGFLDTSADSTTGVTISGIPSQLTSGGYNVYVYKTGGVTGRGGGYRILGPDGTTELKTWKLGDDLTANLSTWVEDKGVDHTDGGNYLLFKGLTAATITIEASTQDDPNGVLGDLGFGGTQRAPLNAVQLVQVPDAVVFTDASGDALGFTVIISDSGAAVADLTTLAVTLDGAPITPTSATKDSSGDTTIRYNVPNPPMISGTSHDVVVTVKDTQSRSYTLPGTFTVAAYNTLPPDSKLATAATTPGMSATTVQLPEAPDASRQEYIRTPGWGGDANRIRKAEEQLVGGYVDFFTGTPLANNVSATAQNNIDYVNWEQQAIDVAGEYFGSATTPADTAIANTPIPGIDPNATFQDYIVTEVVTYLRFDTKGLYRMGVASDDGFAVWAGQAGPMGLRLGAADVGRGVTETAFEFWVEDPGDYPFRLLWFEGTGGANCEWYMIDRQTGNRYLINGPQSNPLAIKAFRSGQPRAYVKSVSPADNYFFVAASKPLVITLVDGATQVVDGSIQLILNGQDVTTGATIVNGATTTVTYKPTTGFKYCTDYNGQLIWTESTTPNSTVHTNTFRFAVGGPLPFEFPALATGSTPGTFWIEAEDFDHDGGLHETPADTMPYMGAAYDGISAKPGIDYNNDDALSDTAPVYRQAVGTELNPYVDIAGADNVMLSNERPGSTVITTNYKIGWSSGADWYNYTRAIPQGFYTAYAAMSYDSGEASPFDAPTQMSATLGKVTAGLGTTTQTVEAIGTFTGPATGGWSSSTLVPLAAADGSAGVFKVDSATTTLQVAVPSGDWDYFVLVPAPNAPPKLISIAPRRTEWGMPRDGSIAWTFQDYATTFDTTSVKVQKDGVDVPAAEVAAVRTAPTTTVTYKWATLLDIGKSHTIDLIWKDSGGNPFTNSATIVGTFMPDSPANMFLVEAEDFNHDGGQTVAAASVMPYLGGAYSNLSATVNIDYFRSDNVTNNWGIYRNINLSPPLPMNEQLDANGTVRATDATGTPTWTQTANYRLGWAGGGNWMNYTRQIPAGTYQVWASQSYDQYADGNIVGNLSQVTSDPTQPNQTVQNIGYFRGPATGGWGANQLFPLRTNTAPTGDAAVVTIGGSTPTTLRYEYASGDFDYFMLVPVGGQAQPVITKIQVDPGTGVITVEWTGGGVLEATDSLSAPNWQTVAASSPATLTPPPGAKTLFGRVKR